MRDSEQRTYTIEELISAIRQNRNIAGIRQIILGIKDINQADNDGRTALYQAAFLDIIEMVRELIAHGADVHQVSDDGKTALYEAASSSRNNLEMVRELIALGADVHQVTNNGRTALQQAARWNNLEVVRELIAHGADVHQVSDDGSTALYKAAESNRIEMVMELIAHGADVNKADKIGRTALYLAAYWNNLEMLREMIAHGADVNPADLDGRTALVWAVTNYNIEMVRELIAHGADETSLNEEQQTQFAEAIAAGKTILIQRNTKSSACALADTGKELQRVSIIQNHPCREASEVQEHENNISAFPESILAKIAAYATDLQRPNSLTQMQITRCAEVGAHSLETTNMREFFHHEAKFLESNSGNTIDNILNGNQNPIASQRLGG